MKFTRKCGILLHPTSLSGSYGIGTLGENAFKFVDWLSSADQSLWQILPLGPTGYGDSPYASFSTFAGNPLLIDLDKLEKRGWALKSDIKPAEYIKKTGNVDFGAVVYWKMPVLKKCALYFLQNASVEDKNQYLNFCKEKKNWLDDFSLFMSIKSFYDNKASVEKPENSIWFSYWQKELAQHDLNALKKWKNEHFEEIEIYKIIQFFFEVQWNELKTYANENGIQLIGDIPIFVASDSADVWSNQKYFQLDENGRPNCVAGVPPDYFSADGQLWGNPLYNWDELKKNNYDWWLKRIKRVFELTDILRIDHFRGFEAYWSVPYGEKTAVNGKWNKGPGIDFFKTIKRKLGDLPIIAEDLGVITEEVKSLRDEASLPGMKVIQFAFSCDEAKKDGMINYFLPHMYETSNCVVYTGTHDNDTLQGWLENSSDEQIILVAEYAFGEKIDLQKAKKLVKSGTLRNALIKMAISSSANYCVIPMQDILGCGNEARMNTPSTTGSNWSWRMNPNDLKKNAAEKLSFLAALYGR